MARIRRVEEAEAAGEIGAAYAEWMAANPGRPGISEILKCFSTDAAVFRDVEGISNHLHFAEGHLTVRVKEMIATFVSALNRCPYCTQSHA